MGLYASCKNTESILITKMNNKMKIKNSVYTDMHALSPKQGPYVFMI
jgi:hypothetical protein